MRRYLKIVYEISTCLLRLQLYRAAIHRSLAVRLFLPLPNKYLHRSLHPCVRLSPLYWQRNSAAMGRLNPPVSRLSAKEGLELMTHREKLCVIGDLKRAQQLMTQPLTKSTTGHTRLTRCVIHRCGPGQPKSTTPLSPTPHPNHSPPPSSKLSTGGVLHHEQDPRRSPLRRPQSLANTCIRHRRHPHARHRNRCEHRHVQRGERRAMAAVAVCAP